jgi:hypothetical protein
MYDPKGADASSGGEWIEVYNDSDNSLDLTTWIFFENETNHSISTDGEKILPKGGYAVISRDITAFRNFFIDYQGLLFKASFLLNDGERLALKERKDGPELSIVEYTSNWGAKGDGNSLQRISDKWLPASPTPGKAAEANVSSAGSSETSGSASVSGSDAVSPSNNSATGGYNRELPHIKAYISGPSIVVAGANANFEGSAIGLENKPLQGARHLWNFGDGQFLEGEQVTHSWASPGDYVLFLEVTSERLSGIARKIVKVLPANVFIERIEDGIDNSILYIRNDLNSEVDISGWFLKSDDKIFIFPKNSVILAKSSIPLASSVAKMSFSKNTSLYFPNGSLVSLPSKISNLPKLKTEDTENRVRVSVASTQATTNQATTNNQNVKLDKNLDTVSVTSVVPKQQLATTSNTNQNINLNQRSLAGAGTVYPAGSNAFRWYVFFFALLFVGAFGLAYISRPSGNRIEVEEQKNDEDTDIKKIAKEFEIIE